GRLGSLVVVAEGARPKDGQQIKRDIEGGEFRLGGIGEVVAREIAERTGKETRSCVLGHLQRRGAPTPLDRILATRFGVKAVESACKRGRERSGWEPRHGRQSRKGSSRALRDAVEIRLR